MPIAENIKARIHDRAVQTMNSSDHSRAITEAQAGLDLIYAYGAQWASINGTGVSGGSAINQLRVTVGHGRQQIRNLAMNKILPRIQKYASRTMPRKLEGVFEVKPSSRASNDQVAALVGDARLQQQLKNSRALSAVRRAGLMRHVLGSSVIKREFSPTGRGVVVRNAAGQPVQRDDGPMKGRPKTIRTFSHKWTTCAPYEFIRDPSVRHWDLNRDEIIGHEKPMPVSWLNRNFGVNVETKSTMGSLLECQRFLYSAIGNSTSQIFRDSLQPGVMVSEWWAKDDDSDSENEWPYWMLAYRDVGDHTTDKPTLKILQFGKNPYFGLPLHHLIHTEVVNSPWARGIPNLARSSQDAFNLAIVNLLRGMVLFGHPRWSVEQNTLLGNVQDVLTNRQDLPIVRRKGTEHPKRIESPFPDPQSTTIVDNINSMVDDDLNMAPVQRGEAVKRGEAAQAYAIRRDSADTPIQAVIDEDRLALQDLFGGTLHDIAKTDSVKVIKNLLSDEFTDDQIKIFKQQDNYNLFSSIEIQPDRLTPRTPQEAREDAASAIGTEMISADDARRNLWLRHGVSVNDAETKAFRKQQMEISTMLDGGFVEVNDKQNHAAHLFVISLEVEDPRWEQYTEDQRAAIEEHGALHDEAMTMRAQQAQSVAEPQQFDAALAEGEGQTLPEGQPNNELAGAYPPPQPALQPGGQGIPNEQLPGLGQDLQALQPNALNGAGQLAGVL